MRLWKKPKPEPRIVVHYVGEQITFNLRSRQRCMWCGVLIEDKDWSRIVVPTVEGKTVEQVKEEMFDGTWGGLIAVDLRGMPFQAYPLESGLPPENACVWEGVDAKTKADALQ